MPLRFKVNQVAFVNRALQQVSRDIQVGARQEMQAIGELVAHDAETLALSNISGMARSPGWSDMRVGQNNELVYVVPARRGTRTRKRKRPNLAPLMLRRAMLPAKAHNFVEAQRRFDALVDSVTKEFNGGR